MMAMEPLFEHRNCTASAHLWFANRCARDKRRDGVRDRILEAGPASSGSQIKKEIKAFFFGPLEDDGRVCTVEEMKKTRRECALYLHCCKSTQYWQILLEQSLHLA